MDRDLFAQAAKAAILAWQATIVATSISVLYYTYQGLQQSGWVDKFNTITTNALKEVQAVSKNCMPKIANLKEFWECLGDPAMGVPDGSEDSISGGEAGASGNGSVIGD